MRLTKVLRLLGVGICLGALLFVFPACGKKGPPVPPVIKGNVVASPFDLKAINSNGIVTLTWDHAVNPETAKLKPEGYDVFMAKKGPDDCEGCPFEFKLVGHAAVPEKHFSLRIETGFNYYFRVQAVNEDDIRSDYSKTVQVDYRE